MFQKLSEKLKDTLYLNSVLLIFTTTTMAGFGFIFWLINAKLFSAEEIGIATAIIPSTTIIATASLFGLDNSIVRFLKDKNYSGEFIRSSFFFVTILSISSSIVFGLVAFLFSPTISNFFLDGTNYLIFILLSVATTLNLLCDGIYLANKKTVFSLIVTTAYSFLRTIFPFLFLGFGAGGILLAAGLAQLIGLGINLIVLQKQWGYFSAFNISFLSLSGIWKFTSQNYVASLFTLVPYCVVPIIILDKIGAAESAYYYIVMMVINLLYVIPGSATKSLFAEGSYREEDIIHNVKKSVAFIFLTTIPAIVVLFLSANFILRFFGPSYEQGAFLLQLLSISVIPYGIYTVSTTIFKIKKKSHLYLLCNIIISLSEIILVYSLINLGLDGIGYAILLSNSIAALVAFFLTVSIITNDTQ